MTEIEALVESKQRRTGPRLLIAGGVAVLALGIWAFVTGVLGTVSTVKEGFRTAIDITADLKAVALVPGEASARLEPGRYQVVAIGDDLTRSGLNPGGVIDSEVYVVPFERPDFSVVGSDGSVVVGAPTIGQLVDTPSNDLVAIGEFTVTTGATYTLSTTSVSNEVNRLAIGERPNIGAAIRDSVTNTGKLILGGFAAFTGALMLIGGGIWRAIRSRSSALKALPPSPFGGWPSPPPGS